jgi:ribosome-associated toxin RatA of RatAB toxin-antitoxin module
MRVERSALVPYSAQAMYDLVADVEAYPEFLPGCRAVKVHERDAEHVKASIEMAKGPVHKWFTTINRLTPPERMDLSLVEGPFRHLKGSWHFKPLGEAGSKVSMDIEFAFSSHFVEKTIGPVFHEMVNRLVDAFVERARNTYG